MMATLHGTVTPGTIRASVWYDNDMAQSLYGTVLIVRHVGNTARYGNTVYYTYTIHVYYARYGNGHDTITTRYSLSV